MFIVFSFKEQGLKGSRSWRVFGTTEQLGEKMLFVRGEIAGPSLSG